MSATAEVTEQREPLTHLLGLGLLGTAWRLFLAHWWQLVAVASCAWVAHHYLMAAAVWTGRQGAVPGLLVFSLVPMVPLLATVLMLLILRRHTHRGGAAAFVTAIGSVIVPFLVVYESQGDFRQDIGEYFNAGFWDDTNSAQGVFGTDEIDTLARIPEATSPIVLAVVVAAFLLRAIGTRVVERDRLWEHGRAPGWLRPGLRFAIGYAEVVWIVLGVVVVNAVLSGLSTWWQGSRLGDGLMDWWASVRVSLPSIGAFGDWLSAAFGTFLDGVVTGLVTPLAWLAIGVVIYGLSAAEGISEQSVLESVQRRQRLGALTRRVNPAVVTLAWRKIADPEGRFGALLGGAAMILRSRFVPLLTFCAVYTILVAAVPFAVWDLARGLGARLDYVDWVALYTPISAVASILGLCLTAPLLAAFADALLQRFGAASQLRLDQPMSNER